MLASPQSMLLVALASLALANPLSIPDIFGPLTPKELIKTPRSWVSTGLADANTPLKVQIALKQTNIVGLQEKLHDIADPNSPNYGQWLSKEQVETFTTPSADTVKTVKAWLVKSGVDESSIVQTSPDWLEFQYTVSKMESLIHATYHKYTHPDVPGFAPRTLQYSLPEQIHGLIDTIQPTTAFYVPIGPKEAEHTTPATLDKRATCDPNNITPSCINSFYNVDYTSSGKATLGVTGFLGYSASHTDAKSFFKTYFPKASDFKDASISGGQNSGQGNLEGNLDTQYATALGYPNPTSFYDVGPDGNDFNDQMANFASYLSSAASPPSSVSTSYGGEEQYFTATYLDRICNEFMKAGSRGVSVFFSSGDFGVGGNGESDCSNGFYALWPASCPYSTAVGATQISGTSEQAATFDRGGSTGGGFSYHFSAPSYQSNDTKSYINNNLDSSYNGYYNPSGRGYPDIALVGKYYDVILNGALSQVYGTSASSPSWAALVSVLNDYRASKGKAALGFINPLLYGSARPGLKDITTGNNQGCGTNGFYAAKGWDPTTGLGSLNFAKLRTLI